MNNLLVTKSNDLISSKYELSVIEQKIILYAISLLDNTRDEFERVSIEVRKISHLMKTSDRYTEINELTKGLVYKPVHILDEPDLEVTWFSSVKYKPGKGLVHIEFSRTLEPYLLKIKERFTSYELKNILYFKSGYSIRLYEILKQYERIGKRTITVERLRDFLGVEEGTYKRFSNLEARVIKPAVSEVNEFTDIHVSYKKIMKFRRIYEIKFTINIDDPIKQEKETMNKFLEDTMPIKDMKEAMGLENANFNASQINSIYEIILSKFEDNMSLEEMYYYVKLNYMYVLSQEVKDSLFGYLTKALINDYAKAEKRIYKKRENK